MATERYDEERQQYNISVVSDAELNAITLMANLGSAHRQVYIRKDRIAPRVMEIRRRKIDYERRPHRVSFLIIFSEEVFANNRIVTCEAELMPLSAEHPEGMSFFLCN